MTDLLPYLARRLRAYAADEGANSAVELAMWVTFMVFPFMNAVDMGYYMFQAMQVRAAAQAAVQTAQTLCGQQGKFPVASKCTTLTTDLLNKSVQSTLLGTAVTLSGGTTAGGTDSKPYEAYYCSDQNGQLVLAQSGGTNITPWFAVGGTPSPTTPPTCAGNTNLTNSNSGTSADYVIAETTYNYTPLFKNISLLSLFRSTGTIKKVAWMRIA